MEAVGINWKILIGEVVNFLILFYLLKRFAFKPFLEMLKKRQTTIAEGVAKSAEADKTLKSVEVKKEAVLAEAKENADSIILQSEAKAKERAEEILSQAQIDKEKIIKKAIEQGQKEAEMIKEQEQKAALELGLALAEKILKEKINKEKDKELIRSILSSIPNEGARKTG